MGQRLVTTIRYEGKDIAKMYYHWSAYSVSALREAREIIDFIPEEIDSERNLILNLIHFCEHNGGGIDGGLDSSEWKYIQNMFPDEKFKADNIDRNCGLIAISENGMKEMEYWSEGDITIDLDERKIYNEVFGYYSNIEEYNDDAIEFGNDIVTLEDIPDIGFDLSEIEDYEINDVIDALVNLNGFVCRHGNDIYELIA